MGEAGEWDEEGREGEGEMGDVKNASHPDVGRKEGRKYDAATVVRGLYCTRRVGVESALKSSFFPSPSIRMGKIT